MRPVRRSFGGGGGFGFAGVESMAAKLAIGLVAGSVLSALFKTPLLALQPGSVLGQLRLWQPFTYGFVETHPMGVIFGALILYTFGGYLEASFGSRRLLAMVWGGSVVAALLTVALSFVVPVLPLYSGGGVMATLAWVTYGLSIGRGESNFWGIPVTGNVLAGIGAGYVILGALFYGWVTQIPDLFALVIALAITRGFSPRHLLLRVQHWRLQRQLRGRSRNLRVISQDRPDDRYLN